MDIKNIILVDGSNLEELLTSAYNSKDDNTKIQIIGTIRNSAFNYDRNEEVETAKFLYEEAQNLENLLSSFSNNKVLSIL